MDHCEHKNANGSTLDWEVRTNTVRCYQCDAEFVPAAERQLKEKADETIRQLMNVLGPTAPLGLPLGPDSEWSEALRLLRAALARQTPAQLSGNGQPPEAGAKRRD